MQPVIGIAWPKPDYLKAIERAGGSPRVLRPDHDPLPQALDACDGLLLTGGADVDPACCEPAPDNTTVAQAANPTISSGCLSMLHTPSELTGLTNC